LVRYHAFVPEGHLFNTCAGPTKGCGMVASLEFPMETAGTAGWGREGGNHCLHTTNNIGRIEGAGIDVS